MNAAAGVLCPVLWAQDTHTICRPYQPWYPVLCPPSVPVPCLFCHSSSKSILGACYEQQCKETSYQDEVIDWPLPKFSLGLQNHQNNLTFPFFFPLKMILELVRFKDMDVWYVECQHIISKPQTLEKLMCSIIRLTLKQLLKDKGYNS